MTATGYFITATDTDVGKTTVGCALLYAFARHGLKTAAMKPVACGCERTPAGLRHQDALSLQHHASSEHPYEWLNPYALTTPVSPHIAARQDHQAIDLQIIRKHYHAIADHADITIVEGVGGWMVPLNERDTSADLARLLRLPVILVVGIRLGCLNHALLTQQSILAQGCHLGGWVANQIDPACRNSEQNIDTLQNAIAAPLLGSIPWLKNADARSIAGHLEIKHLL